MNPNESSQVTVETLLALRQESDALRLITEKLRVKEMGPADHIRTKHEVKAFVESGDTSIAETLLKHSQERRDLSQNLTTRVTHSHRQGLGQ